MLSLFRLSLLTLLVAACSTTVEPNLSTHIERDPIEGFWRFSDRSTTLLIERCMSDPRKFCGLLIEFDGEADTRDFDTSDFNKWGERKCRSNVLEIAPDPTRPGFYVGKIQDPLEGQVYAIELNQRSNGILEAHTFLSVSIDETVDIAIESALGSSPSIFNAGSYLVRALAGKELHSEVERWRRMSLPLERCDRPSVKSKKELSK